VEGSEGGLLASEPSRRAFPTGWSVAAAMACGGLLSVTVAGPRRSFTGFPVHRSVDWFERATYRRFGHPDLLAADNGFRLMIVKRSREPGENPGLTRNGDGRRGLHNLPVRVRMLAA
jgi:hypothetical protein